LPASIARAGNGVNRDYPRRLSLQVVPQQPALPHWLQQVRHPPVAHVQVVQTHAVQQQDEIVGRLLPVDEAPKPSEDMAMAKRMLLNMMCSCVPASERWGRKFPLTTSGVR
jgi:hypothetical protein